VVFLLDYIFNYSFYKKLFELEEVFEGELDFIHLSKNIINKLLIETGSSAGILYWLDEIQHDYKIKTLEGIPLEKINQITRVLRQADGILEKVPSIGSVLCNNLRSDCTTVNYCGEAGNLAEYFKSVLAAPLNTSAKKLGVIVLFNTSGTYCKRQLKLLTAFAPRVAVQLYNARLYQLTKETALENAKLYVNISKLYQQATLDELTGLFNRNFLMQRVKEEIKKAYRFKQPLSLLFVDLDHFKKVNDQFGHLVGDQLLLEFGNFIKKSIREYDVACRFGGEEFVILLPQTKIVYAATLAERLREQTANYNFGTAQNIHITASFGVSAIAEQIQFDDENLNICVENLIAWADEALYQAKKSGRNSVVSHVESL
jgi:diguanylate cyclase (GGDEF)-like protein